VAIVSFLKIDELSLAFSGVQALDQVSLEADEGAFVAIIGPNGAGKTSLFNCISGVYHPQKGSIRLGGRDLIGMAPHAIAGLGVARMFSNREFWEVSCGCQAQGERKFSIAQRLRRSSSS
jgi:branched-chain amino acid transport system ATP-binding protein